MKYWWWDASGFRLITRDDDPRYYVPYHVHGVREPLK